MSVPESPPQSGGQLGPAATTPTPSAILKRPAGLTIISILWGISGIYNFYQSTSTMQTNLDAMKYLSRTGVDPWFQFGVPVEAALAGSTLVFALLQFITIYGLWTGKRWSYFSALAIPVILIIINSSSIALYSSAPASLGISSPGGVGLVAGSLFWAVVYWVYIRRPHVKAYLHVTTITLA